MKFSKPAQKILKEWLLDFEAAPITNPGLIPAFTPIKAASNGENIFIAYASEIVEVALGHLKNEHTVVLNNPHSREIQLQSAAELASEARVVLTEIKEYFDVQLTSEAGLLRITKRPAN